MTHPNRQTTHPRAALNRALDRKLAEMNPQELAELRQAIARRRAGGGVASGSGCPAVPERGWGFAARYEGVTIERLMDALAA